MSERLKDIYFTTSSINHLADTLLGVYSQFDRAEFIRLIYDQDWEERALKEKMSHVAVCMHATLPESYSQSLEILMEAAPAIKGFEALSFPEYVALYGQDDWDISLPALGYFTRYGSAEFAIRPFIVDDVDRAMKYMYQWSEDADTQVRRLSCEGCRPRLPWGIGLRTLQDDPSPILPILENLKDDPDETVRRSVANNVNDISKDHPELVLDICEGWYGKNKNRDWIVKHACRTLLKSGSPRAMRLFGFGDPVSIHVRDLSLDSHSINIGDDILISFTLVVETPESGKVRLEFAVEYVKAHGKSSRKVFQIKEKVFDPGIYHLEKKHSFKERSTRRHYPGEHSITIIVNGIEKSSISLMLMK